MILFDYQDSLHKSYQYIPNMSPNIFLDKEVYYSVINAFKTKQLYSISSMLFKRSKNKGEPELQDQILEKFNSEIWYIGKMKQNIKISFKNHNLSLLVIKFLGNYMSVLSIYFCIILVA